MTRSTDEAMALLKATRAKLIARAREIACELIAQNGETHSREVYEVMKTRDLLDSRVKKDFWLGAVFHSKEFAWTAKWFRYSDTGGDKNIHERTVKVWTFNRQAA